MNAALRRTIMVYFFLHVSSKPVFFLHLFLMCCALQTQSWRAANRRWFAEFIYSTEQREKGEGGTSWENIFQHVYPFQK